VHTHQHLSVRYCSVHTNIFPHGTQNLVAHTCTLTFFYVAPKFSAHTRTLTFFCVAPKFSARTSMPISCPRSAEFYLSQAFHCASCIFSAPTCAHSFLCASIPHEFHCRNWGFCLTFSPIYHRHSATMKFVQFHPDNTSSTYATTNRCKLTFLERIYPKSIHELRILTTKLAPSVMASL
jgi:hypothetical protein